MTRKPESLLVSKILAALRERGWVVTKTHGGAYSDAGMPDVLGWRNGASLAIEAKTHEGKTTELQSRWLERLAGQGVRVGVARSVDEAVRISEGDDE